ncbi:phosphodiester glycosidase family protein [Rahnella variigena]|uniref:phosphodiester glycosidase family protein n=1 Tax=Rahnella variigena TaxID=574964 RepID=UPI001330FF8E|nr:phosphodiester glycosidase family protein [Rahnella variigena]
MKKTVTALLIAFTPLVQADNWSVPDLAIGQASLTQKVEHTPLEQGMDFYSVIRGQDKGEGFLLSSGILSQEGLHTITEKLKAASIRYSAESATETSPQGNPLGSIVRIRGFANADEAQKQADQLASDGLPFSVRDAAQEGLPSSGPYVISLLRVDLNQYQGKIKNVLAKETIKNAETVSEMVSRTEATAGINGGFFAFDNDVGDFGAPAGIYVKDGQLLREATNHRPVMIIDNSGEKSRLTFGHSVESRVWLQTDEKKIRADGLNRKTGKLLNCGGFRSKPTTEAVHDFVCSNDNEILIYDRNYGDRTPLQAGTELTLARNGEVVRISNQPGAPIENDKKYIQLTGRQILPVSTGDKIAIYTEILIDGKAFQPGSHVSMISAGPTLVSAGQIIPALRNVQGWNPYPATDNVAGSQDDDNLGNVTDTGHREGFYEGWVLRRHPRTAIGVTKDNIVYSAVVYGRNPGVTEGATITEMAKLMKALSVENAMNLDGGGSSMMVVNGNVTGPASDGSAREISDAVVFIPD